MSQIQAADIRSREILACLKFAMYPDLARLIIDYGIHTKDEKLRMVLQEAESKDVWCSDTPNCLKLEPFVHEKLQITRFIISWGNGMIPIEKKSFAIIAGSDSGEIGRSFTFRELHPDSSTMTEPRGSTIWNTAKLEYIRQMTAQMARY